MFIILTTFVCLQRKLALQLPSKHKNILKKTKKHKHSSNQAACLKEKKKRKEKKHKQVVEKKKILGTVKINVVEFAFYFFYFLFDLYKTKVSTIMKKIL